MFIGRTPSTGRYGSILKIMLLSELHQKQQQVAHSQGDRDKAPGAPFCFAAVASFSMAWLDLQSAPHTEACLLSNTKLAGPSTIPPLRRAAPCRGGLTDRNLTATLPIGVRATAAGGFAFAGTWRNSLTFGGLSGLVSMSVWRRHSKKGKVPDPSNLRQKHRPAIEARKARLRKDKEELRLLQLLREGKAEFVDDTGDRWQPGDPIEVRLNGVSWSPVVKAMESSVPWKTTRGVHAKPTAKHVLTNVSWSLRGNERIGLIGPNGSGKTTIISMILGKVQSSEGTISKRPENMRIAYMAQEANLDGSRTVQEELASVLNDRSYEEIDANIEEAAVKGDTEMLDSFVEERLQVDHHVNVMQQYMERSGLNVYADRKTRDLSGGWQMRVELGKVILDSPDLIVMDEPTNHLDVETVEFMEQFLKESDTAMIIVSHDRYFLNEVCTKIVSLEHHGAETYNGNYVKYLRQRDGRLAEAWAKFQKYQDQLKILRNKLGVLEERYKVDAAARKREELEVKLAYPVPKPEVFELKDFRFPAADITAETYLVDMYESNLDAHDEDGNVSVSTLEAVPVQTQQFSHVAPLLEVEDLHVAFEDNLVLDGVSLTIERGEKIVLVGPNGSGKSTLLRAIVGDLGEDAFMRGAVRTTSAGMVYFPQRLAEALNHEVGSVKDTLYMACGAQDIEDAGGMEEVLKRLRLDGVTERQPVSSLSGGEKARVAFAYFLLRPCGLLILDEPTNHLDIATRELLEDALKDFEGAALVVSHDRFFLREFATRVIDITGTGIRSHATWEEYSAAAPAQWQTKTEKEGEFILQDAYAAKTWSKKKLFRVKKRYGNVGLRRLSNRVDEFMAKIPEKKNHRERYVRSVYENLMAQGVDPMLLDGEYMRASPTEEELEDDYVEDAEVVGEVSAQSS